MNVTLARALKEKNRIAGRLRKAQELVKKENRKAAGSPRAVDVAATFAEAERLSALLAAVKAAIAKANDGIIATIVELEETKSLPRHRRAALGRGDSPDRASCEDGRPAGARRRPAGQA